MPRTRPQLAARVARRRRPFASLAVRLVGEGVHARRVDPAVVEVEERADGDGEIEGFVRPARGANPVEIGRSNARRIAIHFVDESEQDLVRLVEGRRFHVREHTADQRFIAKKFRRNCGVRLQSKRTIVPLGGIRGNELPKPRAERRGTPQDLLGKSSKVRRR